MATQDIASALRRVEATLKRRPQAGLHDDAPATAHWAGGLRVVTRHADGSEFTTDMPAEFGGRDDRPTPGWLFRAGLASCAVTRLAMAAAAEGIELDTLEVRACSRSDARGVFGLREPDGCIVPAGPAELRLEVRVGAAGVAPERLRALVEHSQRCSPVSQAARDALPLELRIEVVDAG